MSDPRRLLEQGSSPLGAELLAAAAEEAPAPEVAQRALQAVLAAASVGALAGNAAAASAPLQATAAAVELSVAPGAGGTAALAKSTVLTSAVVKGLGVGVVALGLGAPGVYQWVKRDRADAPTAPAPVAAQQQQPPRVPSPATPVNPPPSPAPVPAAPVPAAPPGVTRPPASAPPAPAAAARAAPPAERRLAAGAPAEAPPRGTATAAPPTLSQELERVDQARARLQRGDAAGTLRELEHFEAEFPQRQLGLEVSMLRMEALLRAGEPTRARELARQILAQGASPAHRARARAVLEASAR